MMAVAPPAVELKDRREGSDRRKQEVEDLLSKLHSERIMPLKVSPRPSSRGRLWLFMLAIVFLVAGMKKVLHESVSRKESVLDVRSFAMDRAYYQWAGFHRIAPGSIQ
jgi:hypothetical protein